MAFLHRLFGIDEFIVDFELKSPFCAGNKGETVNNMLIMTKDIIRHTDGTFAVVSRYTIFKGNGIFFHVVSR